MRPGLEAGSDVDWGPGCPSRWPGSGPPWRRWRRAGQPALFHEEAAIAQPLDHVHVVADEDHRPPAARHVSILPRHFFWNCGVADRQHFIDDQDLRLEMRGHRKGQPHVHAAGVALDRRIDELFDFGEGDDVVELAGDLAAASCPGWRR